MKILSRSVPECSCMLLVHMLLRESCQQAVQNLGKVGDKGEEAKKEEGKMRGGLVSFPGHPLRQWAWE